MGVETMWIVDPKTRTGRVCVGDDWRSAMRLEIYDTPIMSILRACLAGSTRRPEIWGSF
jgi:hypothetical protein